MRGDGVLAWFEMAAFARKGFPQGRTLGHGQLVGNIEGAPEEFGCGTVRANRRRLSGGHRRESQDVIAIARAHRVMGEARQVGLSLGRVA